MQHDQFLVLSNEDYHANKTRLGHSGLLKILQSPAHYLVSITQPERSRAHFKVGRASHACILEPKVFTSEYAVEDESLLQGTLASLDEYKAAAAVLGVKYDTWNKDELKTAIKATEGSAFRFKDDVQAEMSALLQQRLQGALHSLDDFKAAATSLGIETAKMKKDDLKTAILAADESSRFVFREDVQAEMDQLTQERLVGTLQSLDEYKAAATSMGISFAPLNKEELREAIIDADVERRFAFREDRLAELYDGMTILSAAEWETLQRMRDVVFHHTGAVRLLRAGFAERSIFWDDPETGVPCKIRPDWLAVDANGEIVAIVDYKSARDASSDRFSNAIAEYGYDVQAGMYTDGMVQATGKELPFFFIAQEKEEPFAVCVYQADAEMVRVGREKYRAALKMYRDCLDTGNWPAYQSAGEIDVISLPRRSASLTDYEAFNASWSALPPPIRQAA